MTWRDRLRIGSEGDSEVDGDQERRRERMVDRLKRRLDLSPATAAAMRAVPRHEFVPAGRRDRAYEDRPLPIGDDQTVSAPHMVATMVEALSLSPGDRVLEVGTGCGYHAAVVAEVVGPEGVCSVEYSADLADRARERLDRLGYGGISVWTGDGREGWPDHAPYDAAYLACATPDLPAAVVDQLLEGGHLVAPVGDDRQRLVVARRGPDGLDREERGAVRFVRMRGP